MTALRLARLQVKAAQERLPAPADATRRRCAIWLSCKADRFRAIRPVALRSRPVPTVIALFVPACPRHLLPTLAQRDGHSSITTTAYALAQRNRPPRDLAADPRQHAFLHVTRSSHFRRGADP